MESFSRNIFSIGILLLLSANYFSSCKSKDDIVTPKQEQPVINSYSPNPLEITAEDTVILKGKFFGQQKGQGGVCFKVSGTDGTIKEKIASEYITWEDSLIKFKVPDSVRSGSLYVKVNGNDGSDLLSNQVDYTQRTGYSFISGTIRFSDGSPLEGVTLIYDSTTVYTDTEGKYILNNIPVGTEVVVEPKKSFYTFDKVQKVKAVRGGVKNIDFSALRTDGMIIKTIHEDNLTFYTINKYGTIIVKIPYISDYLYYTKYELVDFTSIADTGNYRVVVNASYFDINNAEARYVNAGYLKVRNQLLSPVKPNDLQIMKLMAYKTNENRMRFYELSELAKTGDYDLVIQTGPSIIKKNAVDNASIDSSINGKRNAVRTSLATINGSEFYIIVTTGLTGRVLLKDLGQMLLDSGVFYKGELNVIGFDGGPSTAIYIKDHPELSYNVTGIHPMAICVK